MFRLQDIQGKCLEEYFDKWGYAQPHTLSLFGANLLLGEDRILSMLSATLSSKYVSSLFDTAFEVDPELSLRSLITQRRRWKNAALAGTYYMVTQTPSIMRGNYTLCSKLANLFLLASKVFEQFLAFFAPALCGIAFISLFGALGGLIGPTWQLLAEIVQGTLYSALYVVFVYVHLKRSHGDRVLQPGLVNVVFIYSTAMAILNLCALLYGFASGRLAEGAFQLMLLSLALPFVSALVSGSSEAFLIMAKSWLVYFLAAPFYSFCGAYSMARLADVSWGNRPATSGAADQQKDSKADLVQQLQERQMSKCALFNLLLVSANLAIIVSLKVLIPRALSRWSTNSSKVYTEQDILPHIFMLFGLGRILQLLLALGFHICRRVLRAVRPAGNPYMVAEQVAPMSP